MERHPPKKLPFVTISIHHLLAKPTSIRANSAASAIDGYLVDQNNLLTPPGEARLAVRRRDIENCALGTQQRWSPTIADR